MWLLHSLQIIHITHKVPTNTNLKRSGESIIHVCRSVVILDINVTHNYFHMVSEISSNRVLKDITIFALHYPFETKYLFSL